MEAIRHFIKRRAAKRAEKKARKLQQAATKAQSIFRRLAEQRAASLSPRSTTSSDLTEDELSLIQSCASLDSRNLFSLRDDVIVTQGITLGYTREILQRDEEIQERENTIDELEGYLEEKETTIDSMENEIERLKALLDETNIELSSTKYTLFMKQLELNARKQDVLDKDFQLEAYRAQLNAKKGNPLTNIVGAGLHIVGHLPFLPN